MNAMTPNLDTLNLIFRLHHQANDSRFGQAFFQQPLSGSNPGTMLPYPTTTESEAQWMDRAMSDTTLVRTYPDERARTAIAKALWEKTHANEKGLMTDVQRRETMLSLVNEEMRNPRYRNIPKGIAYNAASKRVLDANPNLIANTAGEDMDKKQAAFKASDDAHSSRSAAHDAGATAWRSGKPEDHKVASAAHEAAATKFREAAAAQDADGDNDSPDCMQMEGRAKEHDAMAKLHGKQVPDETK